MPGAGVGVDDVVVVCVGWCWWGTVAVCVGEDEVDDYAGGYVDWDPGYTVHAREFGGDFAEVFGACYDLRIGLDVSLFHAFWENIAGIDQKGKTYTR